MCVVILMVVPARLVCGAGVLHPVGGRPITPRCAYSTARAYLAYVRDVGFQRPHIRAKDIVNAAAQQILMGAPSIMITTTLLEYFVAGYVGIVMLG